ncbi:MAG: hypothetical protein V1738_01075 [Patescibacteria group bacterium]
MDGSAPQPRGKMTLLLVLIIGVMLLAASFLAGYSVGNGQIAATKNSGVNCSDSAVVKRLLDAGYLPPEFDPTREVILVNGEITKVGADYIEISAALSPVEESIVLQVSVPAGIEIIEQMAKDPATLDAEFTAFNQAMINFDPDAGDEPPEAPQPFEEKIVKLSDLKVGATVAVNSASNIRGLSEFAATSIRVNNQPINAVAPSVPIVVPENIPQPEVPTEPPPVPEVPSETIPEAEPAVETPVE